MRIVVEERAGEVDLALLTRSIPEDDEVVWLDSSGAPGPTAPSGPSGPTAPSGPSVLQAAPAPAFVAEAAAAERARWSVLGFSDGPFGAVLNCASRSVSLEVRRGAEQWFGPSRLIRSGFFAVLADLLERGPRSEAVVPGCPFALGWVGFIGYECGGELDGPDRSAPAGPDAVLRFVDRAVVVDHLRGRSWSLAIEDPGEADGSGANRAWTRTILETAARSSAHGSASTTGAHAGSRVVPPVLFAGDGTEPALGRVSRDDYEIAVEACREEIRQGNAFQVCLTTVFDPPPPAVTEGDAFLGEYLRIRASDPVPFGAYLRLGPVRIEGRSPERFIRIDSDGAVVAEPIKGTRPRSPDAETDRALREELESSAKDRAENVMIVDLLRNDLLRSAVPGSVRVERLCAIESYRTVHQMVSTIVGRVRAGVGVADVVRNAFPPGSMTGAPKISAMAIADRHEGVGRGAYSGVLGYFSLSGAVDLAVTIRSLVTVLDDAGAIVTRTLGAGGAVTWSSSASGEADEVETKTRSVLGALGAHARW